MIEMPHIGLAGDLKRREEAGKPICVGIVGAGEMGTDLVTQIMLMKGMIVGGVANRRPHIARAALVIAYGHDDLGLEVSGGNGIDRAIEAGKIGLTQDFADLCASGRIDVIVDATGKPNVGAVVGEMAIAHGKHLVMMNVEADVTIGPYLKALADKAGVVYTVGAGDEPSSTMELINLVTALGYGVVAAGKGKNNPLRHDAIPDEYAAEAAARNMNPRMLVEFVDGSKTMVEMAAIANATGLVPDVPGMHGPEATLENLPQILCPIEDGGILHKKGVVDYTVGKGVAPGVFVIADLPHERLHERLTDLKLGPGPYYNFYRPFHLTSLEVPLSCARVVLYGQADMVPLPVPVAEVCAVAKKDLAVGEKLDSIGEYCYRSWTLTVGDARTANAVPCGMIEGGTVTQAIKKGALLSYDNCAIDDSLPIAQMRKKMDAMLGAG